MKADISTAERNGRRVMASALIILVCHLLSTFAFSSITSVAAITSLGVIFPVGKGGRDADAGVEQTADFQ